MTADTSALLSTNWYRIEHLKPRLRGHVRIHRHAYRGAVWYVIRRSRHRQDGKAGTGSSGRVRPPHHVDE